MTAKTRHWREDFILRCGGRVALDEPMSRHTTLGVGGPAVLLAWIRDTGHLLHARGFLAERDIPWRVLGCGSNLLVSDAGTRGATLKLGGSLASIRMLDKNRRSVDLEVGAGCNLGRLLAHAQREGAGGLEVLWGIPGSVGGAIKLNAGTAQGCIADRLVEVCLLGRTKTRWVSPDRLKFGYRSSAVGPRTVVVRARLRLGRRSPESIQRAYRSARQRRQGQPRGVRSAGCFFVNPEGHAAGRLIEQAGCKGQRVGGAMVSTRHANYIVNADGATAMDILRLARCVTRRVHKDFGLKLRREVELWGDFGRRQA